MEKEPFFSIIIPTYNRANMLSGAIESVLNQTFDDWELIVVDDGSTDATKQLVASYIGKDKRIKYIHQENAERSAARNNGITNALGNFICFLDSDDEFAEDHLSGLKSFIDSHPNKNDSIFSVYSTIIDEAGIQLAKTTIETGENDLETVVLNTITPGQLCVPRNLMTNTKFNEKIKISEDTELLYRLVLKNRMFVVDQHTLIYVKHDDNSVNPMKYNAYKERLETLKLIFSYPKSNMIRRQIKRKLLSDCFFGMAKFYASKKLFNLVRCNMLKAIFLFPEIRIKEKFFLLLYPNKAI